MGDVAALVSYHPSPSPLSEELPKLTGSFPELVERRIYHRRIDQRHRPADETVLQRMGAQNARMGQVGGAVNLGGHKFFVVRENLFHLEHRQGLILVAEQNRVPNLNTKSSQLLLTNIQDDRNAPHVTAGQGHVPDHRVHVSLPHEPYQGREEPIGDIHALSGDLLPDGQLRQTMNHPRRFIRRSNPLDQDPTVWGEGVINQCYATAR